MRQRQTSERIGLPGTARKTLGRFDCDAEGSRIKLWQPAWNCLELSRVPRECGLVKVIGAVDGHSFSKLVHGARMRNAQTSDRRTRRRTIAKDTGDTVNVVLHQRIDAARSSTRRLVPIVRDLASRRGDLARRR